jgi:hypothetical protein
VHCQDKPQWFPIDLDASRNEVAMEWVCWSNCQVGGVDAPIKDVPVAEVPPSIRQIMDPRSEHE